MRSLVRPFDVARRLKSLIKNKFFTPTHFDGFYRALVICTNDPLKAGRVKVFIPVLMDEEYKEKAHGIWAWPTAFFAAPNPKASESDHSYNIMKDFGGLLPPPDGSFVYVFFENGDFNKPRYLPFGPALVGGDKIKDVTVNPNIPQENQNGILPWFKWMLLKTPFGRAFFASDDPDDASIMMRGYTRVTKGDCKSEVKPCNYDVPDKSIGPYHCGPKGSEEYDGINAPKAINNKLGIGSSMFLIYEGHNESGKTHDFVLTRDHRHNFVKFSSEVWEASPSPNNRQHCNESKAHIEWAIMEHEKHRDKERIDRLYNHANIKWIVNTEKTHACEDDKFEYSEENIEYMVQMPDWVDIEQNGHRFWMNLKNGNPCDNCGGSGNILITDECLPSADVEAECNCKWRSDNSHEERRAVGIFRSEHMLKWVVGDDTPSDESLFKEYHTGKRFMEYLFNGEFLIQDENKGGDKGFIELFPCDCTKNINGFGDSKFYMRLKDGHSLWESVKANTHIEFIPENQCECSPKGITNTFLTLKGNGQTLLQSKADMFIEQVPTGKCSCSPNGNGHTYYRQEENGHVVIQSKADMFMEMRPTGGNSCPIGNGETFLLLEENGHVLLHSRSGSYIEILPSGHIIINSVAGGGNIYEN